MPTTLENLQTAKDNIASKMAELSLNPKPTYSIDGQSVSWESYWKMLADQLDKLNGLIVQESGPIEFITRGCP